MLIGAQLFTLRDFCKTTEDLDNTLKRVADMGMTTVQLSGVCAYDSVWMAERLKAYGLTADITHFSYDRIVKESAETSAFHAAMNCKYIGIGGMPQQYMMPYTTEKLNAFFDEIRPAVEVFAKNGQKFMYHNHNREVGIVDGKTVLEHICDAFPAEQCGITVDTYWLQYAGENPVKWLYKLAGRTDCVHFKDMSHNANGDIYMVPNGEGMMEYDEILKGCVDTGVKYAYIEQDNCNGEDPFDCLKRSYDFFKSRGFH